MELTEQAIKIRENYLKRVYPRGSDYTSFLLLCFQIMIIITLWIWTN